MSEDQRKVRKKTSTASSSRNKRTTTTVKNNASASKKKRKSKKAKKRRIITYILFTLVFFITIGYVVISKTFGKLDNVDLNKENLGVTSKEELSVYDNYSKIKNIALFGVDSSDGVGRSDAIVIATVDPVHDKLKITSLMRDTYVKIKDRGYDKLNHAYAYGGPELAINTLNTNFGLNIEDFVSVDFASLPQIIDIFGGIELDITNDEIYADININSHIDHINETLGTNSPRITTAGTQTVNGVQALAYSRIRYTDGGDYKRTERQRTILNKLFEKALSMPVSKYPNLVNQILPFIQTNLTSSSILSLATKVVTLGDHTLEQERFPRDENSLGDTINGVFYLTHDEEITKKQIMDYIFDDKK